jgi:hypothetical protein
MPGKDLFALRAEADEIRTKLRAPGWLGGAEREALISRLVEADEAVAVEQERVAGVVAAQRAARAEAESAARDEDVVAHIARQKAAG